MNYGYDLEVNDLIEIKEFNISFDRHNFLFKKNLSFKIDQKKKIVGIVGPSGSGKTSFLLSLSNLLPAKYGTVHYRIDDHDIILSNDKGTLLDGNYASFIPQHVWGLENLTIEQNAAVAVGTTRLSNDKKKYLRDLASQIDLFYNLRTKFKKLSVGERQRYSVIFMLLREPKLLFADEVTSSLDVKNSKKVFQFLKQQLFCSQLEYIFLVTHDPHLARMCDYLIDLDFAPRSVC
ncbi:MAG: ATP-binding cassette domain-containing protein [Methanobacteriota archaeon]|nr:MAG: ATP-binding cassette domain-containing protein [Euryarchaeota archaeon]